MYQALRDSAPATTSARTASPTWSSACPAGSTRPWSPCWLPTRSGPSTCTASRCRPGISSEGSSSDAAEPGRQPRHRLPASSRSKRPTPPSSTCWRPASPAGRRDLTEENLQSRIRGVILMALSNKLGWLVLTTGNKSELAVGYSTLYGDTAGGFAVIKDVPKTTGLRLCALAQRAGGSGPVDPRPTSSPSRRRPSCAPTSATTRACRRTRCSTRSSMAYVEGDLTAAELVEAGYRRRAGPPRGPPGRPGRVQAAPDAAGGAGHAQGVRPGPPDADHQPLPLNALIDVVRPRSAIERG